MERFIYIHVVDINITAPHIWKQIIENGGGGGGAAMLIYEVTRSVHDYPVPHNNYMLISITYHLSLE